MKWYAMLIAAAVLLAGCAAEPEETTDAVTASTTTAATTTAATTASPEPTATGGEANQTQAPVNETDAPRPNRAPNATFTADVQSGQAPLTVNLRYNASDADGDALTWTLDSDGDGTADSEGNQTGLPGEFSQTFEEGTYKLTFAVSDGQNETETVLTIEVAAAPPPCATVFSSTGGNFAPPGRTIVGSDAAGIYIVVGTAVEPGIYMESNGIPGLQTIESCPTNHDSKLP